MVFYLKLTLVFAVLLPFTLIAAHFDDSVKTAVVMISALGALITEFVIEYVQKQLAEPKVKFSFKKKDGELLISISTTKPLDSLAIDLPVLGGIKNFHDNNSVADGKTTIKRLVGSNTALSQNNIEIYIENMKPNSKLDYKVLYQPLPQGIQIAGTDRCKVSYSWLVGGEQRTMSKWLSLTDGEEVKPPEVNVKGFTFHNRAMSPDEIKALYEEGISKRNIGE